VTRSARLARVSNGSTEGTTFEVCAMARCDAGESFDVAERYHLSLPLGLLRDHLVHSFHQVGRP
jgi:hypothetical protein